MPSKGMGDRISTTREARGMSASAFARLVGVTPTAVWNWENSGTQPRHEALTTIAKVLGVTVEFLVSGSADAPPRSMDVDSILARAAEDVARVTGMKVDRVKVRIELS